MGCSKKACLKIVIKLCFLLVLLVLFFKVYFINQVTDFAKGLSTVSTRYEHPESIEPPTITICFNEAFKTSVAENYGINSTYDIAIPKFEYPYDEVTYKLDRDFELALWMDTFNGQSTYLHQGLNSLEYKSETYEFFVDYVQTLFQARCTKIMPKFTVNETPFFIHTQVTLKSSLKHKDQPTGFEMYLTSNDTWQGILGDYWIFQPARISMGFKETYSKQVATLSLMKVLIRNGVDSQSKCIKNVIFQLEKCGLDCNPWVSYDKERPMCSAEVFKRNENAEICAEAAFSNVTCFKPKELLFYSPIISNPRYHRKVQGPTIEVSLDIINNLTEIREEILITETHDFIGSLGGSLGMFFGFAIISWIFTGIDKIFEKLTRLSM